MIYDDDYYEPPDPRVDSVVWVRCTNPKCENGMNNRNSEFWWNPTVESEYQGEYPMGGYVDFYTDDSHECEICGEEGEEVE